MTEIAAIAAHIARGMIPAHIYSDPEVFELERERVFGRSWVFLAHESEIPAAGDFVLRRIVDDSFIVVRDNAGAVRVHFNMCIHRGMQVCRAEQGNATHFRCPYHGWTYRNNGSLAAVPFHDDAYGGEEAFPRAGKGLIGPAQVDSINGLIFANLDPSAPPLRDFVGDFAYYLDFYSRQSGSGLELRGPQRWRVRANWKIGCENFVGDMYHTPHTHRSVVDIAFDTEDDGTELVVEAGMGSSDKAVGEDLKDVAKTTEKTAKDIGHAAVGAADRAGQGISEAGDRVGAGSQDAWITTKVKSELASKGFDPLRVYVDTDGKVVTLSGTVESAAEREKAVALARAVKDVASVTDHLFVGPARR